MTSYAAAHANPRGVGDERPTARQIILDESLEGTLKGKVIVVTGTSSGIGVETARALSATGATLLLTARDVGKAKAILGDILEDGRVSIVKMDVASFASVREAAETILSVSRHRINILINNAGVMGIEKLQLTEDGHEMHFETNHLGHFLLFQLLKPALLAGVSPEFQSRVVVVSSSFHRYCELSESDNYNFQKGEYNWLSAYANSKLANIYFANEIDRRYGSEGLHATSVHPGSIDTGISQHVGQDFVDKLLENEAIVKVLKSPEQGAATTVVAAVGKEWEGRGGRYLEDCQEAKRGVDNNEGFEPGYVRHTYDQAQEERLWKDSLRMVSVEDDI